MILDAVVVKANDPEPESEPQKPESDRNTEMLSSYFFGARSEEESSGDCSLEKYLFITGIGGFARSSLTFLVLAS